MPTEATRVKTTVMIVSATAHNNPGSGRMPQVGVLAETGVIMTSCGAAARLSRCAISVCHIVCVYVYVYVYV